MPVAVPTFEPKTQAHAKYKDGSNPVGKLPVVDFTGFDHGNGPRAQEIAKEFYEACRDVGFVYLKNFGMDLALVDEMFGWSKKFFDLPLEVKMKAPHPDAGWHHRGYSAPGRSKLVQLPHDATPEEVASYKATRRFPDSKESFEYGHEDHPYLPNIIIPDEDLPGFREALIRYFEAGKAASQNILKALAIGMPHVPEGFLEKYHAWGDNQIRLLHYPPTSTEALRNGEIGRIGEHTDFGSGTFLFQDDTGGLEVEDPFNPGTFLQAKPMKDHAIFNIGDLLQRWSNNTLRSTCHRVRCPPDFKGEVTPARYSIPYFFKADPDSVIDCLPGTYNDTDKPKMYQPITALKYVSDRHNQSYQ